MNQHRGVVVARNGMVAASQPLAVSAGLSVLQAGGNCADAAIAVSSVLAVVEPYASHLGGDAFVIYYDAASGRTTAFNASGAAPGAVSRSHFENGISVRGMSAASVPGLVDAWYSINGLLGTRPVDSLIQPAIRYAADGFPAGFKYARVFADNRGLIAEHPGLNALLGEAPAGVPGALVKQPHLAWSLEQIASGGRDAFYCGPITDRILSHSRSNGGLFAEGDFASHRTQVTQPLRIDYRGHTVHGQPPVSQGHILLQQLGILSSFDLAALGEGTVDTVHLQVEAKKLAFADRLRYLGDPEHVDVPMTTLLCQEYLRNRSDLISMKRAADEVQPGSVEDLIDHDTTYFCVVDGLGNAISFIQSIFWVFGSAAVADGTGILFNNRMTGFSLDPQSPNCLEPGKRTAHTLNAYLVTHPGASGKDELCFVGGTPGGDIQVQSNMQVICNMLDFGMNPQQAIEAPRWQHGGSVGAPGETTAETLAIENRVEPEVTEGLKRRGHNVELLPEWGHGSSYQLIARDAKTGTYMGGSDPRCDGHAAGF